MTAKRMKPNPNDDFKNCFDLTVMHQAFSFSLACVYAQRGELIKGSELLIHEVPLPEIPAIEGFEKHNPGAYEQVREATKKAREHVMFSHFFKDSWNSYRDGDQDEAIRLFKVEWTALQGGATVWPDLDVDELVKRRRAVLKRGYRDFRRRYILTALWDGVISHMKPGPRVELMREFAGEVSDLRRAIDRDITVLKLPKEPGRFGVRLRPL